MAKIQIISKKHTPFEDFFSIMEQFDAFFSSNHRFHLGIEMYIV